MTPLPPPVQPDVPLAPLTTIGLGGKARYYAHCRTLPELHSALRFAQSARLPTHVLGGGSNVVFADEGYAGLVLHVGLAGIDRTNDGKQVLLSAAAGEPWDAFVDGCVNAGLQGIECLS